MMYKLLEARAAHRLDRYGQALLRLPLLVFDEVMLAPDSGLSRRREKPTAE